MSEIKHDKSGKESLLYRLWLKSKEAADPGVKVAQSGVPPSEIVIPAIHEELFAEAEEGAVEGNFVKILWQQWRKESGGGDGQKTFAPMALVEKAYYYEDVLPDLKEFFETLGHEAEDIILTENRRTDAKVFTKISENGLYAWVFVFAPTRGREVDDEMLKTALMENVIISGVDERAVSAIVTEHMYFKVVPVAFGIPASDGEDGEIIDCLPPAHTLDEILPEDASAERRGLPGDSHAFSLVHRGDIVCKIVKPTAAIQGISVRGAKIRGRHGRAVEVPRGPNVELAENGTDIIASSDGRVNFTNGKYIVGNATVINGNVDISTGDIVFDGDVMVQGDVLEGFSIDATGDVLVRGMAENTTIKAGGDIVIEKGMNGGNEGSLTAGGNIKCKYLENCRVSAGKCVYSENIICSEVSSDDSIFATGGKGVIIGGTCIAPKIIRAIRIGSDSYRATLIVNGSTDNIQVKSREAQEGLRETRQQLEEATKDLSYLETVTDLTGDRKKLLEKLRLQKKILLIKESHFLQDIAEISLILEGVGEGRVQCEMLYPGSKVIIGKATLSVTKITYNCNLFYYEGVIEIGTKINSK